MTYWVIFPEMYDDGAVLSAVPEDGPEDYQYDEGKPLLKRFPPQDEAIMVFDPNYPDQIKLYDMVPALDTILVVNHKVRDIIARLQENTEFLPITLWDHQQQAVSDEYCIVNPLGSVDAIDMEKSRYELDSFEEDQIYTIDELHLKEKLPETAKIFRAKTKMDQLFIHEDLRKAFEENKVTGYKLFAAEGWDGLDI